MGDDIDDLLDEVESKFCKNDKKNKTKSSSEIFKEPKSTPPRKPIRKTNDLDDAINDIMADDGLDLHLEKNLRLSEGNEGAAHHNQVKLKCASIQVGGSSSKKGSSTSTNSQCCDRLHCTSCDNGIVCFDDYQWDESRCDYLAFRNNYPDYSRLKYLLSPRKGYRSYCCQCSWLASKDVTLLKDLKPNFKWICKKH